MYDHNVKKTEIKELDDSRYKVTIEFTTEKQIYDEKGKPTNIEFAEWIEIGLLTKDILSKNKTDSIIHIEKVFIDKKDNMVEIITSTKPTEVVIDPYFLNLDKIPHNNRSTIK